MSETFWFGYKVYNEGVQPVKWREEDGEKIGPSFSAECAVNITSIQFHGLSLHTLADLHPWSPPVTLT